MRTLSVATALLVSAFCGFVTAGAAMPPAPALSGQTARADVVPVRGCHSNVRTHYVPEFGRSVRHFHRGNCRPVLAGGGGGDRDRRRADCHRDVRTHRVGGVMLRHRHVGENCAIREVRRSSSSVGN